MGHRTHWYMLESIPLFVIRTITSIRLSSHALRRGVWAQVMRVVDYPHFSLNKFKSLGNTFWYNALPFIMFYHAFHTSLTKPILARISLLQHSLVMFLEHRVTTHFHMYHVKYNIFGLIGHIWPPKTIIESIYLSFNLFVYLSIYLSIYLSCFTLSYTKNIYCY